MNTTLTSTDKYRVEVKTRLPDGTERAHRYFPHLERAIEFARLCKNLGKETFISEVKKKGGRNENN